MKQFTGFKKGINLGGWISQCGNNYNKEHYETYITEADIEIIAGYGVDHVRMPIDYNVIQQDNGELIPEGFKYIDNCLEWCHKRGLNVVIDLHKCCGFVFDNKEYCSFFTDEQLQKQFIDLWKEIARRYGQLDYVAFELLNEITAPEMAQPWNKIIRDTIPCIREIAPKIPIILGGIYNSSIYGLSLMDEPMTDNLVYTFHCYSPFAFTHQAAPWIENMPLDFSCKYPLRASEMMEISERIYGPDFATEFQALGDRMLDKEYFKRLFVPAVEFAEKYNVPLYCGEYGCIDRADCESTLNWFRDFHAALDEIGIARSTWTYKEMDFGITQEHCKPIYKELVELIRK